MSRNNAQAQAREHDRSRAQGRERSDARRVARDEAAERKRAAKTGFANPCRTRPAAMAADPRVRGVRRLLPLPVRLPRGSTPPRPRPTSPRRSAWASAKRSPCATTSSHRVHLSTDGIFGRWLRQHHPVRGRRRRRRHPARHPGRLRARQVPLPRPQGRASWSSSAPFSVPGIALAVPQFLLFAKLGLTNTPWAMIIPSPWCPRSACT